MKYLIVVIMLAIVAPAYAGDLNIGLGTVNPHSNVPDRCADPGYHIKLGYDYNIFDVGNTWFGARVELAPELTYFNYSTAARDNKGAPRYDIRREHSVNLSVVAKPGLRVWRLTGYYIWGIGYDWLQADGFDWARNRGHGLEFELTDELSIGLEQREILRQDRGKYNIEQLTINWRF